MTAPPPRIVLDDVDAVLRRHEPTDVDALYLVVEESRDHLRPFMPWADEAHADIAAFVADAIGQWDAGGDHNYLLVDGDGGVLGGCGLHARLGPGALEIGYWLRSDATGRGVMTAAARALTATALDVDGVERVEIHCDEANVRSAAVARRLGYRLDRIQADHISAPGDLGRSMIWVYPPR